ncbi:OmpA family protein [Psychrobacter sp. DM4]|uniref:OmpA family protein n=1 Tax=Psychrobacter sp. DM4 TaxID=3440637 RepID=UPI003F50B81E
MKIQLTKIISISLSFLVLSACQTPVPNPVSNNRTDQIIDIPVVEVSLDSDSDGYSDDIDMCPGTPMNITVDERGCPLNLMLIGVLKMEYRAFFAKGSSELSSEYQLELDRVAQKLQEYDTATMAIEGHASTDETSANDTALQPNALARNRTLIVKNYLIMQHQIDPNRLSTASYGAKQPIASSDTEDGKSMNRRVYGLAEEPLD